MKTLPVVFTGLYKNSYRWVNNRQIRRSNLGESSY